MSDAHEYDCEKHKGWHGETQCAWCMQDEIERLRKAALELYSDLEGDGQHFEVWLKSR